MDFLTQIDWNAVLPVLGICAGLCIFGGAIVFILQIIGAGLSIVGGIVEFVLEIVAGGPFVWCGCFLILLVAGACGLITMAFVSGLQTCGTDNPLILCRFFG